MTFITFWQWFNFITKMSRFIYTVFGIISFCRISFKYKKRGLHSAILHYPKQCIFSSSSNPHSICRLDLPILAQPWVVLLVYAFRLWHFCKNLLCVLIGFTSPLSCSAKYLPFRLPKIMGSSYFQPNHLYSAYWSAVNFQSNHLYPAYWSATNFHN